MGELYASPTARDGVVAPLDSDPSEGHSDRVPQVVLVPVFVRRIRTVKAYIYSPRTIGQKVFCVVFWLLAITAVVLLFVFWPRLVDDVIDPALQDLQRSIPATGIAAIIVFCCAVFPLIFLTCSPLVWLAAFVFNFGVAFAVCMVGHAIGTVLPYLVARTFARQRVQAWLPYFPKFQAVFVAAESAGDAKIVLLMRIGPLPYSFTNYFCGLLEGLTLWKYALVSWACHAPFIAADVYFGRSLKGLADLLRGESLSAGELAIVLTGFCASLVLGIGGVIYFRRALGQLRREGDTRAEAGQAGGDDTGAGAGNAVPQDGGTWTAARGGSESALTARLVSEQAVTEGELPELELSSAELPGAAESAGSVDAAGGVGPTDEQPFR